MVGRFNRFSGTFTYDSESTDVTPAVAIEIEMDSLDSNHSLRDKHLRADFFETGKYPTATFKSTSFKGNADEGELKGMLTMHGVSKEVAVTVRKVGGPTGRASLRPRLSTGAISGSTAMWARVRGWWTWKFF
jgi:polyisoprenoid-binding protein YceI